MAEVNSLSSIQDFQNRIKTALRKGPATENPAPVKLAPPEPAPAPAIPTRAAIPAAKVDKLKGIAANVQRVGSRTGNRR